MMRSLIWSMVNFVGWVERSETQRPDKCWVSFLNPTYLLNNAIAYLVNCQLLETRLIASVQPSTVNRQQ
ncbi:MULTISPECIES: hypothetical protein [Calothrix]|uniref:Transposase n=2 Tax=Calothrix TaxID=1186 RepID=A0ABR8ACL3_9CYAN|nr:MULTISPECIES: hypothetical protein [Calothrix]MBD2197686.1 hypothetical protein [Calothrix parietina FACHB-288]MBD2225615.1 hypothetical protein [Calothrix anomala FACHB-343]